MTFNHYIAIKCECAMKIIHIASIMSVLLIISLSGCIGAVSNNDAIAGDVQNSGAGFSRENPASINETVKFTKNIVFVFERENNMFVMAPPNVSGTYVARLTLLDVKRGPEAEKVIDPSSDGYTVTWDNKELLCACFKIDLIKMPGKEYYFNVYPQQFTIFHTDESLSVVTDYRYDSVLDKYLKQGESQTGWVSFLVDKNESTPLIIYGLYINGITLDGIWFKAYR